MSTTPPPSSPAAPDTPPAKPASTWRPAIGPRLRRLYHVLLALLVLVGANSVYLAGVTFLGWTSGSAGTYQTHFYLWMFLVHVLLGLAIVGPFVVFGFVHARNTFRRKNRRAVRVGWALLVTSVVILVTGLLLVRTIVDLKHPSARSLVYWLHVGAPVLALWMYWLHRLVGPKMQWRLGLGYSGLGFALVAVMAGLHAADPRWNRAAPESGAKYFEPSLARTADGKFIPAESMMRDQNCKKCHPDVHARWSDSVHRFSSFNNAAYLASVMETREVMLARDGNVQGSRWCAGCHDPVPFFSGKFDDPKFDVLDDPTASAGISCTVCHAITEIDGHVGNANFTIEEPIPYPFDASDNAALEWLNEQLIKAKPSLHKRTFLKPLHTKAEFCGACHKVHLPYELNHYREFLRGQDHYDAWRLSGVSGMGARSFYYPPVAQTNCNGCHMPTQPSQDFAARPIGENGEFAVHDHLFPSANTGVAWLRDRDEIIAAHQEFLQDITRVEVFGVREVPGDEWNVDGELHAPLRPEVPTLKPGGRYLFEVVVRTTKLGHQMTQGTSDSNELWLDVVVKSGDRIIGRSGAMNAEKGREVDPWAWFLTAFVIDREGNRIDRRNPQDIFTKLYDHQIPPGAGQSVHYAIELPDDLDAPVTVEVELQYRKFDQQYMNYVAEKTAKLGRPIRGEVENGEYVNDLPITTMARDRLVLPVEGVEATVENETPAVPEWVRWNDYGIGLLLTGKAQLKQAEEAFAQVEKLDRWDGPLNLARVHERVGDYPAAVAALERAAAFENEEGFPWWTWSWLSGVVNARQSHLEEAAESLRKVVEQRPPELVKRKFDFSKDDVVLNELGRVLFDLGTLRRRQDREEDAEAADREAIRWFERTLEFNKEDFTAHFNLARLYRRLGDEEAADRHETLHARYQPDENAQGVAVGLARQRYPAANKAAEPVVINELQREGAPGLPDE